MAILAMDEDAFMNDRKELVDRLKRAEMPLITLAAKVESYREKSNVNRLLMELDALDKQMKFLRKCLKEM